MLARKILLAPAIFVVAASGSAMAAGVVPGQYELGGAQSICLVNDGTWYGTNFTWSGHWQSAPGGDDRAAIWGNYQSTGAYYGFYNGAVTVERNMADWYDWADDGSYSKIVVATSFVHVKEKCDPPSSAIWNLHRAASQ